MILLSVIGYAVGFTIAVSLIALVIYVVGYRTIQAFRSVFGRK